MTELRAVPAQTSRQAMSKSEIWVVVEGLSRLLSEASRRGLDSEMYAMLDEARAVALGMYSTASRVVPPKPYPDAS